MREIKFRLMWLVHGNYKLRQNVNNFKCQAYMHDDVGNKCLFKK